MLGIPLADAKENRVIWGNEPLKGKRAGPPVRADGPWPVESIADSRDAPSSLTGGTPVFLGLFEHLGHAAGGSGRVFALHQLGA